MKIAEALIHRSDLNKKIQSLKSRMARFSVVQDGDIPHENPEDIFREACGVANELSTLICKIEQSNISSRTNDGRTIAELLAERDSLIHQHSFISAAIEGTKKEPDRYGMKEIKWVTTISVKDYQKRMDDYAKKIRDLNILIQEANWKFDIV